MRLPASSAKLPDGFNSILHKFPTKIRPVNLILVRISSVLTLLYVETILNFSLITTVFETLLYIVNIYQAAVEVISILYCMI
jgi:hypothetical protein